MSRFLCNKREPCKKCGACCHIREKKFLNDKTDLSLRKRIFSTTGIIYLEPLWHYTVSLTENEAKRMKKLARGKKIEFNIMPKKISIEGKSIVIQDYYINHDICPFMKDNLCTIYRFRPKVCRDFPKRDLEINSRIIMKVEQCNLKFEDALKFVERKLKNNKKYK
ncbi:YkgJ family cysteine cluster protein [Candidatus Woesearchaeota archaeon]|nr:YkgJ family cysteine cluster protein [Candidatus Woesearchaeota archaeon]